MTIMTIIIRRRDVLSQLTEREELSDRCAATAVISERLEIMRDAEGASEGSEDRLGRRENRERHRKESRRERERQDKRKETKRDEERRSMRRINSDSASAPDEKRAGDRERTGKERRFR